MCSRANSDIHHLISWRTDLKVRVLLSRLAIGESTWLEASPKCLAIEKSYEFGPDGLYLFALLSSQVLTKLD